MNLTRNDSVEMKKDVSVIIAIRNEEGFIHRSLDSLVNQDFSKERYEIIVVDGMSVDKTREILSQYQTKHFGGLSECGP